MRQLLFITVLVAVCFLGWRWKAQRVEHPYVSPVTEPIVLPPVSSGFDADAIQHKIVHDGAVDERALEELCGGGDSIHAAVAYYIAARYEYQHKFPEFSLRHIEHAEQLAPGQFGVRLLHAVLLVEGGRYTEAITQGEIAVHLDPKSAEAQRVLGQAYYHDEQVSRAIECWQRSLDLKPDDNLKQYLEKAEREIKVEGNFVESRNGRFVIRYEDGTLPADLKSQLFETLESQYGDIAHDLGEQSHVPITVSIYTRKQFMEVTRAPEWVGALNDGQLRIPLGEVTTISPHVRAMFRHELTHWFVHEIAHQCPVWLNEGLAQSEEPRSLSAFSPQVRQQLHTSTFPALPELEAPFLDMPASQAQTAYAVSLAAVDYLRTNYGVEGVRRTLVVLGEGKSIDEALHSATGIGYAELQQNLQASLKGQTPVASGVE